MIVKKPTIVIYTCQADETLLREVCAGIEEEGVLYELASRSFGNADALSLLACDTSMLGVGIGMNGKSMSLHIKGMNVNRGSDETMALFAYEAPSADEARGLGANGARVIKKRPLRLSE